MLSKLIKHELKATGKYLLPMYLILLVVSLFDRIVLSLDIFHGVLAVIPGFLTMAYIVSIIAIILITFVLMIMRFYKNLLGEEGYLMFTLPIRADQLLTTKLVVSTIWTLLSSVTVIASLLIAFASSDTLREIIDGFQEGFGELYDIFGGSLALLIIEFIVMILLGISMNTLMIYVSIAVGQLFNGHRVLGSFIAYMGIYITTQIVLSIIIGVGGLILNGPLEKIHSVPSVIIPIGLLIIGAISAVYYFAITYIFRKKLNLE